MRDDTPAALPLIALAAGLALPASPREAMAFAAVGGLLALLRHRRTATTVLFLALGIVLALRLDARRAEEARAFATFPSDRFVTVEVPLVRDWAKRGDSSVLRAERFRTNGLELDTPIAVYARFDPPAMTMEATLRAEGFLKRNEHGDYTLTVKSPRLMAYTGRIDPRHPSSWNRMLANRLRPHAEKHPTEVALVEALVLGRGERLTEEVRASFRRGGTYHLLVFSGLQIALAAGVLAMLLRWRRAPRASDWLLLGFAVLAPLFIGATASVARASIAIGLYALSRVLKRPTSLGNLWCVAALLRLLVEPRDLTDASFHLTYAGAGALLFLGKVWGTRLRDIDGHARTRGGVLHHILAVELAITPLTLFHFHQYALGGSLLTLLLGPLIFAMLVVATLACAFPCDTVFDGIALLHRLCAWLNDISAVASGWYASPPLAAMIAGFGGALLALAFLRGKTRAAVMALALLIPLAASVIHVQTHESVDAPRALFLDVGQGDAIALRARDKVVLVDGGPHERRLLPLLLDRGITRIDLVVLSHAHPDHCGGLPEVIDHLQVGEVWINPRRFRGDCASLLLEACARTHTPIHLVKDGHFRAFAGWKLRAHLPDRTFRRAPENNASIVLRAEAGGRSLLLTGDIEREAELWLADRDLRSDILKIAHHGSRGSSTKFFLDAVTPRLAVVSCGRRNAFGHPHPKVLDALAARRIRLWRTDRGGTIEVEVRGGQVRVSPRFDSPPPPP